MNVSLQHVFFSFVICNKDNLPYPQDYRHINFINREKRIARALLPTLLLRK